MPFDEHLLLWLDFELSLFLSKHDLFDLGKKNIADLLSMMLNEVKVMHQACS